MHVQFMLVTGTGVPWVVVNVDIEYPVTDEYSVSEAAGKPEGPYLPK